MPHAACRGGRTRSFAARKWRDKPNPSRIQLEAPGCAGVKISWAIALIGQWYRIPPRERDIDFGSHDALATTPSSAIIASCGKFSSADGSAIRSVKQRLFPRTLYYGGRPANPATSAWGYSA